MIYLINKDTNEIIQTFKNIIEWGPTFVEYDNGGYRAKRYCSENEYFTDVVPIKE